MASNFNGCKWDDSLQWEAAAFRRDGFYGYLATPKSSKTHLEFCQGSESFIARTTVVVMEDKTKLGWKQIR